MGFDSSHTNLYYVEKVVRTNLKQHGKGMPAGHMKDVTVPGLNTSKFIIINLIAR